MQPRLISNVDAPEAPCPYEARLFRERLRGAARLARAALRVLCYSEGMWQRLRAKQDQKTHSQSVSAPLGFARHPSDTRGILQK
jgi:hypothetical protein